MLEITEQALLKVVSGANAVPMSVTVADTMVQTVFAGDEVSVISAMVFAGAGPWGIIGKTALDCMGKTLEIATKEIVNVISDNISPTNLVDCE